MADYQPNSHKSKVDQTEPTRERKVEKVVKGKVKTKKNDGRKLANIFISEEISDIKTYLFGDIVVPMIKEGISKAVEALLFGGSSNRNRHRSSDRVPYRSYYDEPRRRDDDRRRDARSRFDYDDLIFETRGEAELVRDRMFETLDRYGVVTVADMYDMADLTAPYTAGKYGWMGLRYAEVKRVRDGYILQLPKAMPID